MSRGGGYPYRPWEADPEDRDKEMFRVIRGNDGRPLLYISRDLSANEQEDLAKLIESSSDLVGWMREVFYNATNRHGENHWTKSDWLDWRKKVGPTMAELWPTEWTREDH